jgi:DNA-damage-inducible protein J
MLPYLCRATKVTAKKGGYPMAETTNLNIRIDKELKERAEAFFNELGLNMSSAFNIFVRQSLRQGKIPFELSIVADPFYSSTNMAILRQSIQEANEGRFVTKTLDELRAMEE